MQLTKETFLVCKGCKYNAPYNGSESACKVQELMYKGMVQVKESCKEKQERVWSA